MIKRFSAIALFFVFALFACGCESVASTHLAGPAADAEPMSAAAEAVDSTKILNVTLITQGEVCSRVAGGGMDAVNLRELTTTGPSFVRYAAYESVVSGTDEIGVCFELYTKADPAAAPTATACFSWEVYAEVAVITTFDGRLSLGYRKHRP